MRRVLVFVVVPSLVAVVVLWWTWRGLGASSVWFAFVVVWAPMTWLGTVSRVIGPRLPGRCHELREFERDGRVYERLGVKVAKALLRRGPLAAFNPHLHLPTERTPAQHLPAEVERLDQRMRDAEASHTILFVVGVAVVVHAAARGWWVAAVWTLLFDVVMNGYPVMLQRYNRALLARRFAGQEQT